MDGLFCANNDWKRLNIFAERSILDVWQGFEYAYDVNKLGTHSDIN